MVSSISVKVEFSRPLTGAEIISAVREVVGNHSGNRSAPRFYSEQRDKYEEAFSIGQTSSNPHEHLLVIPPRRGFLGPVDYFRINQRYPGVEVTGQPQAKAQVEAIAQKLQEALMALR